MAIFHILNSIKINIKKYVFLFFINKLIIRYFRTRKKIMSLPQPFIVKGATIGSPKDKNHKITISPGCVIHPQAIINAKNGPIIIGERNLIEERTSIINCNPDGSPLIIGSDNVFENGCDVRANRIESFCTIGIQSTVSNGIILEDGVILAARVNLSAEDAKQSDGNEKRAITIIPSKTSIFGQNSEHFRKMSEMPGNQIQQLEYLREILPKFHTIQTWNNERQMIV